MRTLLRGMARICWLLCLASSMVTGEVNARQVSLEQAQGLLREGRYAELDALYEAQQRLFQQQPQADEWLLKSFERFSELRDAPEVIEPALDAWVSAFPHSYVSRAARGVYYAGKAFGIQNNRGGRDLDQGQYEVVRRSFDFAKRDLLTSLDLNPMPLVSHAWLMAMALSDGEYPQLWRYFRAAVAYAPTSQELHYKAMWSLMPARGGSLQAMEAFATERERALGPGLTTNTVWGMVWYERIGPLIRNGDYSEADRLLSQALAKYGSRRLYCARARARVELGQWDGAMQDMSAAAQGMTEHAYCARVAVFMAHKGADRADMVGMLTAVIAANPEDVDLRRNRGWVLSRQGRHAAAYEDLLFAAERGDAWSQAKVAGYHLQGLAGIPVDPARAVELFKKSASQGDMQAQQSLAMVLKSMGLRDEADLELRRYRVSEAARPRLAPAERAGVMATGPVRHLLDPRVQAVALATLVMLWILARARRP